MASNETYETTGEEWVHISARDDEEVVFPHRYILQKICQKPDTWFYDDGLAAIASGWRHILRVSAELEDRSAPDKPESGQPEADPTYCDKPGSDKPNPARRKYDKPYPSGQFTELFLLVDVLHHWMHHQSLYRKRRQNPYFRDLFPARNDIAPHVALVRSTIASLAMSDFGSWLEYMTKEGPDTPDDHLSASFILDHSPAGLTLQWVNRNGKYRVKPKVNLGPLFPEGRPRYVNPRMFPVIAENEDEDDGRIILSWWFMDSSMRPRNV